LHVVALRFLQASFRACLGGFGLGFRIGGRRRRRSGRHAQLLFQRLNAPLARRQPLGQLFNGFLIRRLGAQGDRKREASHTAPD
jgi:hypothetical protein